MSSPNEFTVLTWPPKSLYPNPVDLGCNENK